MKYILNITFIFCLISIANAKSTTQTVESITINSTNHKTPSTVVNSLKIEESVPINKIGLITISTNDCANGSPCFVVASTSDNVLSTINRGLTPAKTHNLIQNIVIPQFNFTLMTKYAMGNNWKLTTPAQQKELIKLFQNLLIFTYSSALTNFKDADISINNVSYRNSTSTVMTKVILPNTQDNQAINVEYDLVNINSGESQPNVWKAYDIKIENASLVTTYRTQFNEIIQANKVDGLITQLKNKVANLKSKGNI